MSRAAVPTRTSARPWRSRSLHRAGVILGLSFRGCTKETSEMFAGLDKEQQGENEPPKHRAAARRSKVLPPKLVKRSAPRWGSHSTATLQHRQWLNGAWVPRKNGELEEWEITTAQHHCSEFPTRCFIQCEISISSLPSLNTQSIHEILLVFKIQAYESTNLILSTFILNSRSIAIFIRKNSSLHNIMERRNNELLEKCFNITWSVRNHNDHN